MLLFEYLRELAAEFRSLSRRNPRLAAGVGTVAVLLAVLGVWQMGAWLKPLFRAGLSVSGTVTLDGQPLARGMITFHDAEGLAGGKPVAGAPVVGGRYAVAVPPGLRPGRYIVRIWSPREVVGDGLTTPPAEERIPAEFNEGSSLLIDVRRLRWNTFHFVVP
jgi:hypothetical protein